MSEYSLWHRTLGHAPLKKLKQIGCITHEKVQEECLVFPMEKLTKQPFPTSQSHAAHVFELLHMDIWGAYRVESRGGHRFFLTIVDDNTRTTWVTHLKKI